MRTASVKTEEQYQLIMECRRSGLSDQQWCLAHDIKPGTFYNWVRRLRQKGCQDIPVATGKTACKSLPQEVVKIERSQVALTQTDDTSAHQLATSMELSVGNICLRIPNGTDPLLLAQTIKTISELLC